MNTFIHIHYIYVFCTKCLYFMWLQHQITNSQSSTQHSFLNLSWKYLLNIWFQTELCSWLSWILTLLELVVESIEALSLFFGFFKLDLFGSLDILPTKENKKILMVFIIQWLNCYFLLLLYQNLLVPYLPPTHITKVTTTNLLKSIQILRLFNIVFVMDWMLLESQISNI